MSVKQGAKWRLEKFFLEHLGVVVDSEQLREVAGVSEWARRVRELRNEMGYQIYTHKDRADLKPGEYILISKERLPAVSRNVSASLRAEILERNGFTCQICGNGKDDKDPLDPSRNVRLVIDHRVPIEQGGSNKRENLQVVCSACNQGKANSTPLSEDAKSLLARIRRCSRAVQREIYQKLKNTFGE